MLDHAATPLQLPEPVGADVGLEAVVVEDFTVVVLGGVVDCTGLDVVDVGFVDEELELGSAAPPHALIALQSPLGVPDG